jgi:hypothetical protein
MAGRGPAPASQRRRRNEPARGDWIDLPPLEAPVLPDLPRLAEGEWPMGARLKWSAWQADPVTQIWTPADISFAVDTIRLYVVMTPSSANEVRLREDGLGLTPKGKRDLRVRIAAAEDGPPELPRGRPPKATSDRRARLSVVK